jgi:hypothetical protein
MFLCRRTSGLAALCQGNTLLGSLVAFGILIVIVSQVEVWTLLPAKRGKRTGQITTCAMAGFVLTLAPA